ncbi:MAG: BsuPI-related putative proteinase inhibitor [Verrucomicrobium sp.]|nr:BsuPI-related putative proteinase inhibitor [Verrucomicrobium sp.]
MRRLLSPLLLLACAAAPLHAVDISPSRDHEPNQTDASGQRFSIFSSDPTRIQKANSIDFRDFQTKLELNPATVSLSGTERDPSLANNVRATLSVKNTGKQTYTLSFPNTQRYEIAIKNPAGQTVYRWSLDKKFLDQVGLVMINPTDKIAYAETISFNALYAPLETGTYTVEFAMANYPEVTAKATFTVTP